MTLRSYLIVAGVVLAVGAGAFAAGRFAAPMKVETREVERVVFKDRVVEKVVTVTLAAKTKIVWRDRVVAPDGTTTTREVEKTDTREDTTRTDDRVATSEGTTEREAVTITTNRPGWRVGALVGLSLREPLLPIAGPLILGLSAERRLIGGLWAGLWIQTGGSAGLSLSLEF